MSVLPDAALAAEVTTLALCWRIRRRDGAILGFTSHDRDLWADGVWFLASPGMTPSAVVTDAGLEASSMEIEGVLGDGGITSADLAAGRWSGAAVELLLLDWRSPHDGWLTLARGAIGDAVRGESSFRMELVGDAQRLDAPGAPACSPLCRAEFGDPACGVDREGLEMFATAEGSGADKIQLAGMVAEGAKYGFGELRVMTGRWAGLDRAILSVEGQVVRLEEALGAQLAAGDVVRLREGCDKRFATCCERFGNGLRFGGEPHVPGTDALLRYGDY